MESLPDDGCAYRDIELTEDKKLRIKVRDGGIQEATHRHATNASLSTLILIVRSVIPPSMTPSHNPTTTTTTTGVLALRGGMRAPVHGCGARTAHAHGRFVRPSLCSPPSRPFPTGRCSWLSCSFQTQSDAAAVLGDNWAPTHIAPQRLLPPPPPALPSPAGRGGRGGVGCGAGGGPLPGAPGRTGCVCVGGGGRAGGGRELAGGGRPPARPTHSALCSPLATYSLAPDAPAHAPGPPPGNHSLHLERLSPTSCPPRCTSALPSLVRSSRKRMGVWAGVNKPPLSPPPQAAAWCRGGVCWSWGRARAPWVWRLRRWAPATWP